MACEAAVSSNTVGGEDKLQEAWQDEYSAITCRYRFRIQVREFKNKVLSSLAFKPGVKVGIRAMESKSGGC